ncbi:MAG TPA: hypothetical protein VK696_06835 [Steroidobacteraceae bacterium]|jgi:hypothetical protein|nr:hypothetical protein [Steroidobacteraceae bacterium]
MQLRDEEVPLSAQRLRELMLWHGKDEGNLPPAATLVNLSRDTIAALTQLQQLRSELAQIRTALSQLFWSCESSELRQALLVTLGEPPENLTAPEDLPIPSWAAAPNGLPPPDPASDAHGAASPPQWRRA